MSHHPLSGIYAAAITPIHKDNSIAFDDIPEFLAFLAENGCHGALLHGTTGEGPSFSLKERLDIFHVAIKVREAYPQFRLFAGTGTPSLEETVQITKSCFDIGFDAAVVLPPYYYHRASAEGLTQWFQEIINRAVPEGRTILGYHFPDQTGVPIPIDVITTLRASFPGKFAGFKDSTGNASHTFQIGNRIDRNTLALVGNEGILLKSLEAGSSGSITAMANLYPQKLRTIWDCYQNGISAEEEQKYLISKREILNPHRPYPAVIKALLHHLYDLPEWSVRLPLTDLPMKTVEALVKEVID